MASVMQGDAYNIPVTIKSGNGTLITPEIAACVEITVGQFTKRWPGQVTFDEKTGEWQFPVTQKQTFRFAPGAAVVQARVVFQDGSIMGGSGAPVRVEQSASRGTLPQPEKTEAVTGSAPKATEVTIPTVHDIDVSLHSQVILSDPIKAPYIGDNGNWYEYDAATGTFVDTGTAASGTPPITPDTAGKYLTNDGSKAEWAKIEPLPEGGAEGQVLTKKSDANGDAEWEDKQKSVLYEPQDLTAEQKQFARNNIDASQVTYATWVSFRKYVYDFDLFSVVNGEKKDNDVVPTSSNLYPVLLIKGYVTGKSVPLTLYARDGSVWGGYYDPVKDIVNLSVIPSSEPNLFLVHLIQGKPDSDGNPTYTVDKTFTEIKTAYDAGKKVELIPPAGNQFFIASVGSAPFEVVNVTTKMIYFRSVGSSSVGIDLFPSWILGGVPFGVISVRISSDEKVSVEFPFSVDGDTGRTVWDLVQKLPQQYVAIVTAGTDGTLSSNSTLNQLQSVANAYNRVTDIAGSALINALYNEKLYYMSVITDTSITFTATTENGLETLAVSNDGKEGSTDVWTHEVVPLGSSTDISLGLTSAAIGQTIKVKTVDTDGKPTAWEAVDMATGGGGETWELINEVTLSEDAMAVVFDKDKSGAAFGLRKFAVVGWTKGSNASNTGGGTICINVANTADDRYSIVPPVANHGALKGDQLRYWHAAAEILAEKGWRWYLTGADNTWKTNQVIVGTSLRGVSQTIPKVATYLALWSRTSGSAFAAGSEIKLYGVRA